MSAAVDAEARPRPASPYKGLAPFQDSEADELLFFGREREREVIVANLLAARLTILYGPSGVGKSSVLRAAVVRDLRALPESPLVVVHDSWSEEPAPALTRAIAEAAGVEPGSLRDTVDAATSLHEELYVVLDGLEEYFVYRGGAPALGEALAELTSRTTVPIHVLLGIREDVLARLDAFKTHVPGLLANRLRLEHLTRDGGRRAIVGPLERFAELVPGEEGLSAEPALVDAVLDGVRAGAVVQAGRGRGVAGDGSAQSGVEAPYLQVVMQRLWEEESAQGSHVLRLATLERLGGPGRIVESHLERALEVLTPAQKELAARMFNHLVTPSGTKIAHGAGDLAKYAATSEAELEPVLVTLGNRRILRPIGGNGADAHEIYHDVLADAVLAWRGRFDAEQALEQERAASRRRHRRLLIVFGISLVALAVTGAVAVFALTQRSEAREEARRAHARELVANALTDLDVDPSAALEQALEAARLAPSRQAEVVLRRTLLASRLRGVLPADDAVTSAVYSPDGKQVLTASLDGKARIFDAGTHALLRTFDGRAALTDAVFDRTGEVVVTAGRDGKARVWNARSGRLNAVLPHGRAVLDAAFTQGGGLLMTTSADRTARIWDAGDWSLRSTIPHRPAVLGAAFNHDGSLVVTRSADGLARIYDTSSGRLVQTIDHGGKVHVAIFSPTGRYVLTGGEDKTARIWLTRSGALVAELTGHRGEVRTAAIAPDSELVATAGRLGQVRVWSFPDGEPLAFLRGHANDVTGLAFSPDGGSLVSTSLDRTARVWKAASGEPEAVLVGSGDSVTGASFDPDGRAVVTASRDGTARIWDPQDEPRLRLLARTGRPVRAVAFSPDGAKVLVAGPGRQLSVRNAGSGKASLVLPQRQRVRAATFSLDGSSIVYAGGQDVRVVSSSSPGKLLRALRAESPVASVAVAPDGRVAAGGSDGTVWIWDADGGPPRTIRSNRARSARVAFSPDSSRLAVGTSDGLTRIWDPVTEQLVLTTDTRTGPVASVAFSPDGTAIVTSADHDASVWSAETGVRTHVLVGHVGPVADARFSPDDRWIVTAGPASAGLWDWRSERRVFFMTGHTDPLTSVAFDSTSTRILTGSLDGTVRTYSCAICGDVETLIPLAEKRLLAEVNPPSAS